MWEARLGSVMKYVPEKQLLPQVRTRKTKQKNHFKGNLTLLGFQWMERFASNNAMASKYCLVESRVPQSFPRDLQLLSLLPVLPIVLSLSATSHILLISFLRAVLFISFLSSKTQVVKSLLKPCNWLARTQPIEARGFPELCLSSTNPHTPIAHLPTYLGGFWDHHQRDNSKATSVSFVLYGSASGNVLFLSTFICLTRGPSTDSFLLPVAYTDTF